MQAPDNHDARASGLVRAGIRVLVRLVSLFELPRAGSAPQPAAEVVRGSSVRLGRHPGGVWKRLRPATPLPERGPPSLWAELSENTAFAACSSVREEPNCHGLIYAGDLTPASGVADLLGCAIAWANKTPERSIDVCWVGGGPMEGILRAQPLPGNLKQHFLPSLNDRALAAVFAKRGLLVVPNSSNARGRVIIQAMLSGLPVLASVHDPQARALVSEDTGWLFDPLRPGSMFAALEAAMQTNAPVLNRKRAAARARASGLPMSPPQPCTSCKPFRSDSVADPTLV
jgi:glycosyltransferase involved in cell wall biosynthesis